MKPEIVTLCHSAVARDGIVSILEAFSMLAVPKLPHTYPLITLVCRLAFEASEAGAHKLNLRVVDPDGRKLAQMKTSFHLTPGASQPTPRLCICLPIAGMELRFLGEHVIDLILEGHPPLRFPFEVQLAKKP
jgi:hypothetical protein